MVCGFESCVARLGSLTQHHSLHSALREFFEPLRTNDPCTDFFAIYRKESEEFDKDYVNKYNEDLNTSLIFVSSSVSILDVRY